MVWSVLRITAGIFGMLSIVCMLSAIVTSSWMKACLSMDNIFSATSKLLETQGKAIPSNFDKSAEATSGMQMCVHLGLFRVSMKIGDVYEVSFGADASTMPQYLFITIIGFMFATIIGIAGLFVLLYSSCASMDSYEEKAKNSSYTRKAAMLFTVTGLITLGAMICYTAGSSPAIHDPVMFMAHFGKEGFASLGQMGKMSGLELYSKTNRGKRSVNLGSLGHDMEEFIRTMVEGMDPAYSYSFILGWISILLLLITTILNVFALLQSQHSKYTSSPQNIKL